MSRRSGCYVNIKKCHHSTCCTPDNASCLYWQKEANKTKWKGNEVEHGGAEKSSPQKALQCLLMLLVQHKNATCNKMPLCIFPFQLVLLEFAHDRKDKNEIISYLSIKAQNISMLASRFHFYHGFEALRMEWRKSSFTPLAKSLLLIL